MSKFRLELDVSFNTEDEMIAFANLVEDIKTKAYKGTGSESISIIRNCRYHECFHDETPPKQCGVYKNVNFDAVKEEHKNKSNVKVVKESLFV